MRSGLVDHASPIEQDYLLRKMLYRSSSSLLPASWTPSYPAIRVKNCIVVVVLNLYDYNFDRRQNAMKLIWLPVIIGEAFQIIVRGTQTKTQFGHSHSDHEAATHQP